MKKARIIERTAPDGNKKYVIQQKHFLFRWWWVDAWLNFPFRSLEEAEKNLCWFDGTPWVDKELTNEGD